MSDSEEETPLTFEEKVQERYIDYLRQWVGGGVFFTPQEGNPFRILSLRGPFDYVGAKTQIDQIKLLRRVHALAWDYLRISNAGGPEPKLKLNPPDRGLMLRGAGTFNKFYVVLPPGEEGHDPLSWEVVSALLRAIGYGPDDYNTHATLGRGKLPYGIGVRVQKTPIRIIDDMYLGRKPDNTFFHSNKIIIDREDKLRSQFSELLIGEILAEDDLAPPLLGSVLLQNDLTPWNDADVGRRFGYNVVSFFANAQTDLAQQLKSINAFGARHMRWRKNPENQEWLRDLGKEIVRLIYKVSRLGLLLVDIKPGNMLYCGMRTGNDPNPPMTSEKPKVWMADFDVDYTAFFPDPSGKDQRCIEIVNILMFLNTVQCLYTVVFSNDMSNTSSPNDDSPVGFHVMQPLRERLVEIGDKLYDFRADNPTLCDLMLEITDGRGERAKDPLWDGSFQPLSRRKKMMIARQVHLQVKHYSGQLERQEFKCFPYRKDSSLLQQMFIYLSEWNPPDYSWEERARLFPNKLPPRGGTGSVVEDVFREFKLACEWKSN